MAESLISPKTAHSTPLFMTFTRKNFVKFKFTKNILHLVKTNKTTTLLL